MMLAGAEAIAARAQLPGKGGSIGRSYTRRRLRRPDALNVGLLSASLSASRFYTRRLKGLRRLIHPVKCVDRTHLTSDVLFV